MNKLLKTVATGVLILATALTFTGCQKQDPGIPWFNEDGTIHAITKEQLDSSGAYYIKRGDEYYRLFNHGIQQLNGKNKIIWYTSEYEVYYPTLKKGDEIIYISNKQRPAKTEFTYYEDCGYTIGTQFTKRKNESGTEIGLSQTFCPDSPIQSYLTSGIPVQNDVRIMKINNNAFSPLMLDDMGFIHNLTKNAMYKIWFYMGTVYGNVTVKADTHIYKEIGKIDTSSYVEHEDTYFTLVLPEMPNGYYSIDGYGWFLYNDEDNKILPETIVEEINEKYKTEEEALENSSTEETQLEQPTIAEDTPEETTIAEAE